MWRWGTDPFWIAASNQNPGGLGTFVYNLRFPGQYYQAETGLNYNYFRDYDPQTGRYIESDPIGLDGGTMSTYTYVGDSPLMASDPLGLFDHYNHNRITRRAIAISGTSCKNLPQAVALVDAIPGNDLPKNSFWHAMRDGTDPSETVETASAKYLQYVQNQLGSCSCDGLARALHAVQDSFAAGHVGFQPWYGGGPLGWPGASHLYHDMYPSESEKRNATDASAAMLAQYNQNCPSCAKNGAP